jgi:hypothetical protein
MGKLFNRINCYTFLIIAAMIGFNQPVFSQANNNPCVNAPALTVNATCVYTASSMAGATYQSNANNFGAAGCGSAGEPDVWYKFVAPASGNVDISTTAGTTTDGVMEVYTANCAGSYSVIDCNDETATSSMPALNLTGLTSGTTYYIRFWDFWGGTGTFNICVKESEDCTQGGDNQTCGTSDPFCTGTTYEYCNTTNTSDAFNDEVPCSNVEQDMSSNPDNVSTSPNPAFYYLEVGTSGDIHIQIEQKDNFGNGIDVDFLLYGPFGTTGAACTSISADSTANLIDCSYSGSAIENANIFGSTAGEVYMLCITNFANEVGRIEFSQTAGGGGTDCSIVPLAVQMNFLEATVLKDYNQSHIQLDWKTTIEENNHYFLVQRRTDEGDFETIGRVEGNGTINHIMEYSFTDLNPIPNAFNYYRLKQVDYDGKYEYSKIVSKFIAIDMDKLYVYPNPATSETTLITGRMDNVTVQVCDLSGKVVLEMNYAQIANDIQLSMEGINTGTYILKVLSAENGLRQAKITIR